MGSGLLLRVKFLRFSKHRRTKVSQRMMSDTVMRFRDLKPIRGEDVWELGEKLLETQRSGELKGTV